MNDVPYLNRNVGPEIIAGMTAVCLSVKREVGKLPCGIQILAGCNEQAVAVAKACSMDFVRAEGFVFSHIADEGIMNADAGNLLRYRKKIEANNIMIFTDVKKKHRYIKLFGYYIEDLKQSFQSLFPLLENYTLCIGKSFNINIHLICTLMSCTWQALFILLFMIMLVKLDILSLFKISLFSLKLIITTIFSFMKACSFAGISLH